MSIQCFAWATMGKDILCAMILIMQGNVVMFDDVVKWELVFIGAGREAAWDARHRLENEFQRKESWMGCKRM